MAPERARGRAGLWFFGVLVVAVGGIGAFLVGLSLTQYRDAGLFEDRAVEVRADIIFATETKVLRNPAYTKAEVSFTPPGGDLAPVFAEIIDCPEGRVSPDDGSVEVLYDPADATDVRLRECLDKGYKLSLISGIGLIALDLGILFSIRRGRRQAPALERMGPVDQ